MNKVVSPEFRASFANVFVPKAFGNNEPKYGVVMLIPKSADISKMQALAQEAIVKKWPDEVKRKQMLAKPTFKNPFRDGDIEKPDMQGYAGHYFVSASSKMKPGVVDSSLQPIMVEGDFYSGCYARATLTAYAYDHAGNVGIAYGLQNLMKTRDGESFNGRAKAEDDFKDFASANATLPSNEAPAENENSMFS